MANQRMWAKVVRIHDRIVIGYTQSGEKVLFSRFGGHCGGLRGVKNGDIVSFEPTAPRDSNPQPDMKPADFFGLWPYVIARRVVPTEDGYSLASRPDTRHREATTACEWKEQKEKQADAEQFREIRDGAGGS